MLHVAYGGIGGKVLRYHCRGAHLNHGADWCISFGGLRVDQALANEVLQTIGGDAVEAALPPKQRDKQRAHRQALEMEAEQARYEARLAERRSKPSIPTIAWLPPNFGTALRKEVERPKLERFAASNPSLCPTRP